jgi:hypothetical protein
MRTRGFLAIILSTAMLDACGGGSSDSSPVVNPPNGKIESPVTLNLYPNQSSTTVPRLTVMVTSVGSVSTEIPAVFDTGLNQQGTRSYGTTDLRVQNGNLGFATLSFGDAQGPARVARS